MITPCEIENSPEYAQALARSVCAIVFREAVVRDGATHRLLLDQNRLPIRGTGFLVAPSIVATALHVVGSADAFALVFDFVAREGVAPDRIGAGLVRDALRLNDSVSTLAPGFVFLHFDDPIVDRIPLALSPWPVVCEEAVFAIGHPAGTTMKYFPPKCVIESDRDGPVFTVRDLGTTVGNSGSPVFAARSGLEVVGAVNGSITTTNDGVGARSRVTAIRTSGLVEAVNAAHHPVVRRMRIAHA